MKQSLVTSHTRPKTVLIGKPSLDPGTERYVIKGGGSAVFALDRDDRLELALLEGGQSIEIVAFGAGGKSDLPALGLKGRSRPVGLQQILATESEDAQRVRFGLFRRGCDIGRAYAAHLLGPDAPAGESTALNIERPVVVAIAAPHDKIGWDQPPPSDVLVYIQRSNPGLAAELRLPEPLAEPRLDLTINVASAISFEVYEGEYIQVVDVNGRQCSDFLAFHRKSLDQGKVLGIDPTATRTFTGLTYPTPGLLSKFFDREHHALFEIIQDTVGRHDMFALACTPRYYEDVGYFGHANCSENFNAALNPFGISSEKGWPAMNYFYNTQVDAHNNIWFDEPWSRAGDYVLMRALTDLVCGSSSCPDDIDPINGWNLSEIQVRVYPKSAHFKRAIGYRMTPDAPLQMTSETGFHSRTSQMTRSFAEYRGYWLPQSFTKSGAIGEYWACRERAAIMDLSPLRKLEIVGPDSEEFLQHLVPRDIRKLAVGQITYTALCYEHGGMVDDGTVFRLADNNFRWIGGDDAGLLWIKEQAVTTGAKVVLKTATDHIHNVALQGPRSRDILRSLLWTPNTRPTIDELGLFRFTVGRFGGFEGRPVLVSRTGYTGELGYEIFCHPNDAPAIWDALMEAGQPHGLSPLGLEALDLLRIEAGLAFGGFEFCSQTDPFEAGIGFTVPAKKIENYIGKTALERRRANPQRKLVGLEIDSNEKVGHGDRLFTGRAEVGSVTSGMRSPILKSSIALARVDVACSEVGTTLYVGKLDGHRKRLQAKVVPFPFYDPEKTRVRM